MHLPSLFLNQLQPAMTGFQTDNCTQLSGLSAINCLSPHDCALAIMSCAGQVAKFVEGQAITRVPEDVGLLSGCPMLS